MGFFSSPKPRVRKEEFKDVRNELHSHGFDRKQIDRVEEIFRADMNESRYEEKGIQAGEVDRGIDWMRKNIRKHNISERKIDIIEKSLKKRL